ncbi:Uncharacterized protein dnm_033510 [Desulfonema magnum]|uniref:Uncharacterized protein n=1 Tax=Desulfonema magnum TaxID=45655 RepID=A0A975BKZ4_9BACT|nr:Uncharacterized protein dnm_033510 [Desulfonema magnum]
MPTDGQRFFETLKKQTLNLKKEDIMDTCELPRWGPEPRSRFRDVCGTAKKPGFFPDKVSPIPENSGFSPVRRVRPVTARKLFDLLTLRKKLIITNLGEGRLSPVRAAYL